MDVARHLFVIGAWAPLTSLPTAASAVRQAGVKVQPDSPVRQSRPQEQTPSCSIPTSGKAGGRYMRAAGYGRPIPRTSSGAASGHTVAPKAGVEQRSGSASKVNSSSSDDTAQAGEGHSKPVVARPGSSPQLATAPAAPPPELPTVAEVLRAAKLLLQPTQAVERQFYADCYRACQVVPSSRPTASAAAPSSAEGAAPPASSTAAAPAQSAAYLSYVPEVALRLSCLGHRIVVRRVTDSKHYWSKSMTNMFCYCVLPGTGIGYVLDPSFKEHFRAGRMSDRYRDVWECLPPLFVGPPAKLVQLVQTLCAELQASFESGGRQLPPWRTFGSTINRWMSPCFQDVPVPPRRPMPPQVQQTAAQQGPEQQQTGASGSGSSSGSGSDGGAGSSAGVGTGTGGGNGNGNGNGNGGRSSSAGMIPAADAQAFLRVCEGLMAGTPSARARASGAGSSGAGPSWPTTSVVGSSAAASAAPSAVGGGGAQSVMTDAHRHLQQQTQPLHGGGGGREAGAAVPGRGGGGGRTAAMRRVTGFDLRPRLPAEELGRLALQSPAGAFARVGPTAAGGMAAFGLGERVLARPAAEAAVAAAAAAAAAAAPGSVGPTWSAAAGPRPAGWGTAASHALTAHGPGQAEEQGAARSAASTTSTPAVRGTAVATAAAAAAVAGGELGGAGFTVRGADAAALAAAEAAAAVATAAPTAVTPHALGVHGTGPPGLVEGAGRAHTTAGTAREHTRSVPTQPPAADRAAVVARAPAGLLSRNLRPSSTPQ